MIACSNQIDAWPNFVEGEYSSAVDIADGTLRDYVQIYCLHDALIFKRVPVRMPAGIFSVPDTTVAFSQEDH